MDFSTLAVAAFSHRLESNLTVFWDCLFKKTCCQGNEGKGRGLAIPGPHVPGVRWGWGVCEGFREADVLQGVEDLRCGGDL